MDLTACHLGDVRSFDLCAARTPEQYAEAAIRLEPRGAFWCMQFGTIKAALYRSFGKLLAAFDTHCCKLYNESLGCGAVELISEFEADYGLPSACMTNYPTDLAGRQAQVCAAIKGQGITTIADLENLLRTALNCSFLTLENFYGHTGMGGGMGSPLIVLQGICVRGISTAAFPPSLHNVMGGWAAFGGGVGQPLTVLDPAYAAPAACPIIYHSSMGGWTGGMGIPLTTGDTVNLGLLACLMDKHLPAHVRWAVCPI